LSILTVSNSLLAILAGLMADLFARYSESQYFSHSTVSNSLLAILAGLLADLFARYSE
jgi:hypothetical protein